MTSKHEMLNHGKFSRREALAAIGLMALSCRTTFGAGSGSSSELRAKKGIALQLYTLREPAKKDLPGTLKKVREMGWEYVQWSGMPDLPADQIRQALDTAGLKAISAHVAMEPFEKDLDTNVRFWKTVGVAHLAPGGMMKDCKDTLDAWLRGAKRLDAIGAQLRPAGIRLAYHNHYFEFEKFPGDPRSKLDILLESTRPENLAAEFDTAWVYHGGADPAGYIRKYKNRCPVIHVKDGVNIEGGKFEFKPLGQGALNWKEIFAAGQASGVDWYVYEQDRGEGSPFDYTQASYEFLKKSLP
jgi:sugar phosphate isomerase/epimerase